MTVTRNPAWRSVKPFEPYGPDTLGNRHYSSSSASRGSTPRPLRPGRAKASQTGAGVYSGWVPDETFAAA